MATISQDPAGQASVALLGIGFNNITATASPFWESIKTATGASVTLSGISFNNIVATVTPVRAGSRITVEGGSFAANFGTSTIINIETPLTAGAIALLDTPGDNAVSTVALSPAQISATRTDRLMAVADPLPRALVHAGQGAAQITQATNTDRLVAVSSPVQNALMAGSGDGQTFVVNITGGLLPPVPPIPPVLSPTLSSSEATPSLNLVVPFAVLQATGAGGNVALPPEGSLEFGESTPSIELSIPSVSLL